jgi:tetratricopeptide (TPR) repeat protein
MDVIRRKPLCAALVLFAVSLAPTSARAQQPRPDATPPTAAPSKEALDEARTRYERGTQLYNEGDYKLAIIEFNRAYEIAPNYKVLFNIGQVYLQLASYAAARRAFERYLKDGGDEIPEKRRRELARELDSLKNRTAHITIITDVPGAEVLVDGVPVGTSPIKEPLLVDAGQRTVEARKTGRISASRAVTLAGTDEVKIEFELPEQPAPVTATAPPPIAPEKDTVVKVDKTSYVWVGWVATGVFAAGATAVGVATLLFADDLAAERDKITETASGETPEAKREALADQQSKTRAFAIATDVLIGAAVLTAGVSLYFTIKDSGDEQSAARPRLRVGVGPQSVRIGGSF